MRSILECNKKQFSAQEVKQVLTEIKSDTRYSQKDKQEKRYYQCPTCRMWHLTSIDNETWKKKQEKTKRIKEHLLNNEADYWVSKKFQGETENFEKIQKSQKVKKVRNIEF